ncbi:hypothetical protein FOL46_003113 [Perkinsus olseni]|nr:hypothetical protein FOL46_003113 [Perkinsus olseni]
MIVDEDPPCPASEDTPAVGNSPLAATRGTHASSETKHSTESIDAAPPAGSTVGPSRAAPVEVVTQSERALERAKEIISTIGIRPSATEQSLTEVEPLGSAKETGSLLDQPLDRFERLYADGAERADRLATAQAQKRMDELLEGPGTATGRRKVVSKETHRGPGHKSPMKPPVSVPIGGQSGTSRFERLYAEGAERKARRKDLEKSIVEEEDAKLKEAMAKARLTTRSTSGGEGSVVGGSSGLWERMSKQEADTRAMRLQKLKEEAAERERREIEASRFCPPPRPRRSLNTSVVSTESVAQQNSSVVEMVERMSKDALDSRRAKLEQLATQYSEEERAKIDAGRFKKPGGGNKSVDIREMTDRLYADGERRRAKLERLQEEAEIREIAQCQGFLPKVSREKKGAVQPASRVERKEGKVPGSIPGTDTGGKRKSLSHHRLYAESKARKERIEKLAKAVKAEEERECTYQPNLRKSMGRYRPPSASNSTLGGLRSPTASSSRVHENLYRERAARDERIRRMREKALEASSVGSRTTPKTPTRKDLHASLHDEVYRRKAEEEAAEKAKQAMVRSFLQQSKKAPAPRPGLHDRLFEESKLRHDALLRRVKEKEEQETAALRKGRAAAAAATIKPSRSMGLPSAAALRLTSSRRAKSCDSTMAGRRRTRRPQGDTLRLDLDRQARLPEVFSIGTPDVTPDSSSRSPRPQSVEMGKRLPQKIILGFEEEVKIPKRKKPEEGQQQEPRVETILDQSSRDGDDTSVDSLARMIVSEVIAVVESKTVSSSIA